MVMQLRLPSVQPKPAASTVDAQFCTRSGVVSTLHRRRHHRRRWYYIQSCNIEPELCWRWPSSFIKVDVIVIIKDVLASRRRFCRFAWPSWCVEVWSPFAESATTYSCTPWNGIAPSSIAAQSVLHNFIFGARKLCTTAIIRLEMNRRWRCIEFNDILEEWRHQKVNCRDCRISMKDLTNSQKLTITKRQ